MKDEYSGIFDHLTPEDFLAVSSTAVVEEPRPIRSFDEFVDDNVRSIRFAWASAEGGIFPLAILSGSDVERMFAGYDDETLGEFLRRIATEAKNMRAGWFFFFKKTIISTRPAEDEVVDVDDPEAIKEAMDAGNVIEAIYWYAEDRPASIRKHGYIAIVDDTLAERHDGDDRQIVSMFTKVLDVDA
jgi:hypothetical protein